MKSRQLKLAAASVGAGAFVAMGALGVVFAGQSDGVGTVSKGPEVTLGETTTETGAPTKLATTFVTPPVTAEKPAGFDAGS